MTSSFPIVTPLRPPQNLPAAYLDQTHALLAAGDISGMDNLAGTLDSIRRSIPVDEWQRYVGAVVAPHPITGPLREEPFTHRAYAKPRGYAGDAPLLDLIYNDSPPPGPLTQLGERLYAYAIAGPACRSVQARRDILTAQIDRVAAERPSPRILSVACGHLREAQRSEAVRSGGVAEFIALDQDRESLAVVEREQRSNNVVPIHGTIRRLLINGFTLGSFDFAYAAGLYDYLEEPVAQALTDALFRMLRPGGQLLVANFAPELPDIGYMEAIMDWHLLYRTEADVARFTARIPREQIAEQQLFRDGPGNVVYLTLRRV